MAQMEKQKEAALLEEERQKEAAEQQLIQPAISPPPLQELALPTSTDQFRPMSASTFDSDWNSSFDEESVLTSLTVDMCDELLKAVFAIRTEIKDKRIMPCMIVRQRAMQELTNALQQHHQ